MTKLKTNRELLQESAKESGLSFAENAKYGFEIKDSYGNIIAYPKTIGNVREFIRAYELGAKHCMSSARLVKYGVNGLNKSYTVNCN